MAFAIVSESNNYNQECEGVPPDQLARQGLSQGYASDLANKAFGSWRTPQFRFVCTTTTAADTGAFVTNLATATRSVTDPQATSSFPITKTLGPVAGVLTTDVVRPIRVRVKQFTAGSAANVFWFGATLRGAATPVVVEPAVASKAQLGTRRAADDDVTFTEAASSLLVTVTHGTGNANITWTIDVFLDDPV